MPIKLNINGKDTYINNVQLYDGTLINRVVVNKNGKETLLWERYQEPECAPVVAQVQYYSNGQECINYLTVSDYSVKPNEPYVDNYREVGTPVEIKIKGRVESSRYDLAIRIIVNGEEFYRDVLSSGQTIDIYELTSVPSNGLDITIEIWYIV